MQRAIRWPKSLKLLARASSRNAGMAATSGPVARLVTERIQRALAPVHLEIENESHRHSGPPDAESHFKVLVVAAAFEGMPLLARHRAVTDAVRGDSREMPVHALSISAKAPSQWAAGAGMHATPNCRGGDGSR